MAAKRPVENNTPKLSNRRSRQKHTISLCKEANGIGFPSKKTEAWPKQFWAPALPLMNSYTGSMYPHNLLGSSSQTCNIIFKLPRDYTSMVSAKLVLYGASTQSYNLAIQGRAGAVGEAYNTHDLTDTRNHALVANTFSEIDIYPLLQAFFDVLDIDDYIKIGIVMSTSGNIYVYGIDGRYN